MHSANFTALSRAVSFVFAPALLLLALVVAVLLAVPGSEGAFEPQPALIRLIRATMARAAGGRSSLLIAASLDRVLGRRTWQGSRDRTPPGAARNARARCRRSGTARTRRRVRTATRRHGRARCRPRLRTRGQTSWEWPPIGWLALPSRTLRSRHGAVAPGTPGNASRCRR